MKEFIKILFDILFIIVVSGIAFVMIIVFSIINICEYLTGPRNV